jgi:hypothetical protein
MDVPNMMFSQETLLPVIVAGSLAIMLAVSMFHSKGVYSSQRLGKSRLLSVLTGQKSVRWSIDELTDKGYMEVCTSRPIPGITVAT